MTGPVELQYERWRVVRRHWWLIPGGLAVLGVTLFAAGLAWAIVTGVAVPDQDPTPAMREYARFHERIVDVLLVSGLTALVVAVVFAPVAFLCSRLTRRERG